MVCGQGETECLLEIKGLSAGYRSGRLRKEEDVRSAEERDVLRGIDLSIAKGKLTALLGMNGSGKTTLLKAACGLIPVKAGSVKICGRDIRQMRKKELASCISYISQKSGMPYHIRAEDVVLMGINPYLKWYGTPSRFHMEKACALLEQTGMGSATGRDYLTLSEGQKQIIILCRALMQDAPVMLFDEPDSALDFENKKLIFRKITEMTSQKQCGGLITVHDPDYALRYCDEILILKDGMIKARFDCKTEGEKGRREAEEKLRILYPEIEVINFRDRLLTVK